MTKQVIPRGVRCTAIAYDGNNFLELRRHIGDHIEKGNKYMAESPLLLDTPYGVQKVVPGDVVVHQGNYWHRMSQEEFAARYEILE